MHPPSQVTYRKAVNAIRSKIKNASRESVHIYKFNVPPEELHSALALLDKVEGRKLMRVTYSDDYNFIVRYMPGEVHENIQLEFALHLNMALVLLTAAPHPTKPPGCRNLGSTTFQLGPRKKQADAAVRPTVSDSRLPSVVLEVGSSESLTQLEIDAKLWLEHTQEVRLVMLIFIDPPLAPNPTFPRITVQLWRGFDLRRSPRLAAAFQVRKAHMVWAADWTVAATPFYILFDDIFRGQVPAEPPRHQQLVGAQLAFVTVLMSIPNPPAAPRILPPSSNSLSISVPSTSPKYPWFDQAASHEHDFAPNASLTPSRRPSMLSTTPVRDLSPIGLGDDSGSSSSSSGATSVEEKRKRKALSVDEVQQSPRTGAIRNRPLRSHRQVRVFHHDQPYPQHQQLSPTHKPHKLPLELPPPTSPTRRRAFRRRHWFYRQLARARRSRFLAHPTTYLALYFTLNLSLTLYNKSLLINFPFPYTLSALHALCGSIGTFILVRTGSSPVPRLNAHETLILLAFSGLYTVNIIVSNVSLGLVTVPFHQVVRASTPLFTILFSALILGTRSSRTKLLALLPVVAGVGFATYGDYYFTPWGFFLTLLGTVLASLKTIFTNFLQTPSPPPPPHMQKRDPAAASPSVSRTTRLLPPLTPLHLLHLLSPLAFVQTTLLAHFSGELDRVQAYATAAAGARYSPISGFARGLGQQQPPSGLSNTQLALLVINGVMAFALNVVSFSANRKVGALSMTVAANVKQVLTVLCAVVLFSLTITPMNAVGIVLTLVGGAVYAAVELKERREKVAD
ncbi:hypothetical protein D9615_003258 [Tricholomella constricta]|uniref:Sugar phosphate transporter domain-containing protein n=1 Tax=Tricholomella constricta TaxID=117010 RepID=A0A8H5M864_9AGAR|nr:hypothetical protein D9615_003258 [Tricholomella constricta]